MSTDQTIEIRANPEVSVVPDDDDVAVVGRDEGEEEDATRDGGGKEEDFPEANAFANSEMQSAAGRVQETREEEEEEEIGQETAARRSRMFLDPASSSSRLRQRRKSPVTVQEWVASLPLPHVMQRKQLAEAMGKNKEGRPGKNRSTEGDDEDKLPNEGDGDGRDGSVCNKTDSSNNSNGQCHNNNNEVIVVQKRRKKQRYLKSSPSSEDNLKLGAEAENSVSLGLNGNLVSTGSPVPSVPAPDAAGMLFGSGGKVQSAAGELHHHHQHQQEEELEGEKLGRRPKGEEEGEDEAAVTAGQQNGRNGGFPSTLEEKRRLLLRSHHDHLSFQSDISAKTTASSVDSVLYSREVDPAELLMDLGFGGGCGEATDNALCRIPSRFFQASKAKGISVEDYLRKQEELVERFDSGFSGYRGLNGSTSSRPSEIVEKIIQKIRSRDRALRRQATQMSFFSSSLQQHSMAGSSVMATAATPVISAATFASVVGHAQHVKQSYRPQFKGAKAFRAAAHSVLSPANRRFMDSQNAEAERPSEDRKIILGGEVFKVNEDLKVIQEENGNEDPQKSQQQTTAINQLRSSRFSKRESTMSMMSSCSVESDWSDEELEELERMLGDIQDRSDAMDNDDDDTCENMNAAIERWKKLRRSRALATQRIKEAAEREEAEAEDGDKGNNNNDRQDDNRVWTTAAAAVSHPAAIRATSNHGHQQQAPAASAAVARGITSPTASMMSLSTAASSASASSSTIWSHHHQQLLMEHRRHLMLTQGDHRIPRRFSALGK